LHFICYPNAQIWDSVNPTDGVNTTTLRLRYSFNIYIYGLAYLNNFASQSVVLVNAVDCKVESI